MAITTFEGAVGRRRHPNSGGRWLLVVFVIGCFGGCFSVPPEPGTDRGRSPDVRVDLPEDAGLADLDLSLNNANDQGQLADAADMAADSSDLGDAGTSKDVEGDAPSPRKTALFIADTTPDAFIDSDARAVELLKEAGFEVTPIEDRDVTDADGYDLVVVSKTCSSAVLGDGLADTTTGMFLWENRSQEIDRFNLISTTVADDTFWVSESDFQVWLDPADSDITGGSDSIQIYSEEMRSWHVIESVLGDGANVVSRRDDGSDQDVFAYVYEVGATRPDDTGSPGRRAYVGFDEDTVHRLHADGEALFMSMARWAAGD